SRVYPMTHIFISYSRQDQAYAQQIKHALIARNLPHWMDDRIDPGDGWWDEIDRAIANCACLVVIMTPAAKASRWVQREILLGEDRGKPIFPLLLAGDNWSMFVDTQYAQVDDGTLPPDRFFEPLVRLVREATGAPVITEADVLPHLLRRDLAISTMQSHDAPIADVLVNSPMLIWGVGPILKRGAILAIYTPKEALFLPPEDRAAFRYLFAVAQDTQPTHAAVPWKQYVSLHRRVVLDHPLSIYDLKTDAVAEHWRLPQSNFRGVGRLNKPLNEAAKRIFWQMVLDRNPESVPAIIERLLTD
ncbi:MAG: toll/interleukin-1 receptor domain-containing protein, partial [Anaerolineae bacterium]|nr:toll/interleukin-1 receptor domain-containing protein [Anaerolineae bacterium]